jgi:hypothetical protein
MRVVYILRFYTEAQELHILRYTNLMIQLVHSTR